MLLVRKISCTKCKYKGNGNKDVLVSCDFEKCKVKDNYAEIIDTDDSVTETYSIDELKGILSEVTLDNAELVNNVLLIRRHI